MSNFLLKQEKRETKLTGTITINNTIKINKIIKKVNKIYVLVMQIICDGTVFVFVER